LLFRRPRHGSHRHPRTSCQRRNGLDFVACNTTNCIDGFGFLPPNAIVGNTTDLFASGSAYGSTLPELFVLANYSLTPAGTTTVPEPATVLGLLSVAGVGLLCKGRKLEK